MAHRGTLQPGQKVQVGQYEVVVEKYLAEGGYAHVYLVNTPSPMMGETRHVLKRIACASDDILREVGMEVQVMKLLRGHPNIVHLHSATSEPHPDGSSVVYILMEFCAGGGIIDYMNRRLRERLTEKEILQIFVDVCEAVASMHALKPPLLHRDLKIENILQSTPTSYKLCDFGSAAAVMPPPSNIVQLRLLEADLNKHTTLQYRAPEMVDVYQRRAIDTKSDVWALGVLLYKLCYYTTPFEAHGPVAIMTASYKIPSYPVYSPELNGLIGKMLQERGSNRPSVYTGCGGQGASSIT
ncbi:serine/threonine-protein kinase ppk30 [Calocera viscosa TUFC12733]|uniref:non-specific serine/threonine protein kinase n=1 Tax=Calocera viscosa (strain TUFC12733) TaxID=1330018 RepID=A0A167M649_CALVF|nr:serine/threonine-protein kinase ppk30 [Calocera viscosa TUFC12733]